jgi:hypothetical protein
MRKVDAAVANRIGLSVHDLPDIAFRDLFDSGTSPDIAASEALAEAADVDGLGDLLDDLDL